MFYDIASRLQIHDECKELLQLGEGETFSRKEQGEGGVAFHVSLQTNACEESFFRKEEGDGAK